MLTTLQSLDSELLLLLNSPHTPILDSAMAFLSWKWAWLPLYIMLAAMFVKIFGLRRALVYLLIIGASVAVTDQLCATVIRPWIGRLRPSCIDNPLSEYVRLVNGYRGGRYGFPSCHASNSFALATFIVLALRRWRMSVFIVAWAALNSYTRIYLGVHYPGDIIVGAIIGSLIGFAAYRASTLALTPPAENRGVVWQIAVPFQGNSTLTLTVGDLAIATMLLTVLFSALQH